MEQNVYYRIRMDYVSGESINFRKHYPTLGFAIDTIEEYVTNNPYRLSDSYIYQYTNESCDETPAFHHTYSYL